MRLILSLVALGQNILMGYAGQLSLGSAGFMAAGAFACYNLILRVPGIPFVVAILLSGVCAALIGIVFGLPSLRIRGLYLAVTTPIAVLHRLGARQIRLVQELRPGGRDHRAEDHHLRPQLRLAARSGWCWSSSQRLRWRPRTWRAAV